MLTTDQSSNLLDVLPTNNGPTCPVDQELSGITEIDLDKVTYLVKKIAEIDDNEAPYRLNDQLEGLVEAVLVLIDHFSWPIESSLRRRLRNIVRIIIRSAVMQGSGLNAKAPEDLHQYFGLTPDRGFYKQRQLEMLEKGEVPDDIDLAALGLYRRERLYERLLLSPLDPLFRQAPSFREYISGLLKGFSLIFGQSFKDRCERSLNEEIGASKLQISWWNEDYTNLKYARLRQLQLNVLVRAALCVFSLTDQYVGRLLNVINDEQFRHEKKLLSNFKLHKLLNVYFGYLKNKVTGFLSENETMRQVLICSHKLPALESVFLSHDPGMLEVSSHVVQVLFQSAEATEQMQQVTDEIIQCFGDEIFYNPVPKRPNFSQEQPLEIVANFMRLSIFLERLGQMGLKRSVPSRSPDRPPVKEADTGNREAGAGM